MGDQRRVDILIAIEARLKAMEEVSKEFAKMKKAGQDAADSVQAGFGVAVAERVVQGFTSIGRAIASAIADGIRFNATVQDAQVGVAAVPKQFDPGKYQTFSQAMAASGDAIDLLKEKARQSPATFEQLVGAFQAVSGAASAANIPVKKQIDLVVLMSQALSGLGIRSDQIIQESRALLTGNITEDAAAARILGITKADIDNAKQAGELYEFLTGRLSGFAEAAQVGARGLNTQLANLTDNLQQLKGAATEEIMGPLTEDLIKLNDFLGSQDSRAVAGGIGGVLKAEVDGIRQIIEDIDSTPWLRKLLSGGSSPVLEKGVFAAFRGGRDASLITQYQKQEQSLASIVRSAKTDKEIADARKLVGEKIVEQQGRIAQQGEEVNVIETQHLQALTNIRQQFDNIVGTQKEHAASSNELSATYSQIEAMNKSVDQTLGSQLRTAIAKATENDGLLRQTQELARLEELIGKNAKQGTLEYMMRRDFARQIIEAERVIADTESRNRTYDATQTILENNATDDVALLQIKRDQLDKKRAELKTFMDQTGIQKVPDEPTSLDALNLPSDFAKGSDLEGVKTRGAEVSQIEREVRALQDKINAGQAKFNNELAKTKENQGDILNKVTSQEERQRMIAEKVVSLRSEYKNVGISEGQILDLATKQVDAEIAKKKAIEDQRDARKEGVSALRDERQLLQDITAQISAIDNDPFITNDEKRRRKQPLLSKQRGILLDQQARGENVQGPLQENETEQRRNSPMGEFQERWNEWLDTLPNGAKAAADSITNTLGAAIDGVSNGISGMILGTMTWRQAFAQAATSIVQDLIRIGVQFVAQEVIKRGAMALTQGIASLFRTKETAEVAANQSAQAAATAPNALMQSITSYGVAAIVGAAAFAAAMAMAGGFAEGGYTGSGGKYQAAGVVHRGEYVFNQRAVNRIGLANLEAIHVNANRGYASGGAIGGQATEPLAGAGGAAARPVNNFILFDENSMRKKMLEHPDADNRVVRVGRRRGAEMGINRA